ncbi:MAG: alanine racemase [Bacteroidales bacterium]|nr:alanine racemase [Bacteroidales bacterium]MBS3773598.1 alanine racemase [Bacteroidales bacterium]
MAATSVIEINRSALIHNLTFLKDYLGKDTKISSVVKANAYGHGIEQFVPIAESAGIDHFAVFSGDEAKRVYHVKQDATDIMVMGWMNQEELEWAVKNGVEFFVFEQEKLEEALELAKQFNTRAIIHIEVETGMNRTGFSQKVLHKVVKLINTNQEYFHVRGLCTHYAGAESIANHVRVQRQIKKYNRVYKWITNRGITPELRHTACSAAAIVYPKTRMDMVRVGILQYGFWPSPETFIHFVHKRMEKSEVLKRVLNWKSQIMSLKEVKEGEFVSYGTHYMAQEEKTIAIIPVGYAHGYSRSLSNQGRVLIHGHRVPVIGIVNMNMLIVDVTQVTDVRKGDEVVLIGDQDGVTITLASFADFNNQLNYELLARLPIDIPRKIID